MGFVTTKMVRDIEASKAKEVKKDEPKKEVKKDEPKKGSK